MKTLTLQLSLTTLTLFASSTAFAVEPHMETLLNGIDSIPRPADLLMFLDEPVVELEQAASDQSVPLYYRLRATSFLSSLNEIGGREALRRLCDDADPEVRRHAVYGLLRSTPGTLSADEWTKVTSMLQNDAPEVRKDIVRGFRWSRDSRSAERLAALTVQAGPLKSLAVHVLKRRNVLMKAPLR